jgi:hypothetical protein
MQHRSEALRLRGDTIPQAQTNRVARETSIKIKECKEKA